MSRPFCPRPHRPPCETFLSASSVVWGVYCHILRPCASASHVYVTDVTLWRYNTVHLATCYLSMLTCRVDLARCLLRPCMISCYFMDRSDVFRHACARLELWIHFARHRAGQQLQSATSLIVSIIFEMRCHYMLWIMLWVLIDLYVVHRLCRHVHVQAILSNIS